MKRRKPIRAAMRWTAAGLGLAGAAYAGYVVLAWQRYGRPKPSRFPLSYDALLDRFIPKYEVAESHALRVAAPAEIAFSAACDLKLQESAIIRAIFRGRELILRSKPDEMPRPLGLAEQARSWGWGVLAASCDRRLRAAVSFSLAIGAASSPEKR